jgi:MFS family permease
VGSGERGAASGERQTGKGVLGVIFLTLLLDLIGFSIVFPLFAAKLDFYMARDSGLLAWAMGLLAWAPKEHQAALFGGTLGGLYAGLQFFSAPIWGRISDRIGRRPVLLIGLTGSAMSYVLWVFSADFTLFLVSRLIAGVMTGNVSVANAAVSDITTPDTRARGMAAVGMSFGLGFVLGPAIGGLTAHLRLDDPAATSAIALHPFSVPALIAAGLGIINLVWAWFAFRETLPPERRTQVEAGRTFNPLQIIDPALGSGVPRLNLSFLLFTLLFSGMEGTLVFLAAHELAFTPGNLGALFAGLGLGAACVQGAYRGLVKRVGVRPMAFVGLSALAPGLLLIGLVDWFPSTSLLFAGCALLSISTGLVFPSLSTLVSLAGDPARQGWVMGSFRSASALGRAIGPLLSASIYFAWRPGAPYLLFAALVALPVLLLATTRTADRR